MESMDTKQLEVELDHFRQEKEQIRAILGRIGGVDEAKRDKYFNIGFVAVLLILFAHDLVRHALDLDSPFPPLVSVELGVLLVSVKIIWMIHKQSKVEHFQFWILNSIEFRLTDLAKQMRQLSRTLREEAESRTAEGNAEGGS